MGTHLSHVFRIRAKIRAIYSSNLKVRVIYPFFYTSYTLVLKARILILTIYNRI